MHLNMCGTRLDYICENGGHSDPIHGDHQGSSCTCNIPYVVSVQLLGCSENRMSAKLVMKGSIGATRWILVEAWFETRVI